MLNRFACLWRNGTNLVVKEQTLVGKGALSCVPSMKLGVLCLLFLALLSLMLNACLLISALLHGERTSPISYIADILTTPPELIVGMLFKPTHSVWGMIAAIICSVVFYTCVGWIALTFTPLIRRAWNRFGQG